ncbi:hypothetical protein P691DRAFT_804732 [Macrolepiota fuliginosa MF-IS2]|uniref:Uncharacterized protein n=1 Tax=Macrolepiota fuliginosa MF-IS2 TaxID=1400762 RepID=A0A9P6C216_9AGAR|nr:hypothetical protein P691DRAFT_804732 [Macrolepiota fuliginosa MF-IS2]
MDEGRRLGFQEGLDLGRRRQLQPLPQVVPSAPQPSRPRTIPRPSSRRGSAAQGAPHADPAPVPPVLITTASVGEPQPPPPVPMSDPNPSRLPEEIRPHFTNLDDLTPIHPMSVHNSAENLQDTFDVPPDNYIPMIREGDPGIVLPPPHEWINRPNRQRSDSQATRPRSGSRASAKSVQPRSDNHTSVQDHSHPHPYPQTSPPRSTAPSVVSHQSSHISQMSLIEPPSEPNRRPLDPRPRMTQPERIADEWRAQNPDVVTTPQGDSLPPDTILRPMSSQPLRTTRPAPIERPTTTDPTRSRTPKPANVPRKTRQVVLPVPVQNIFYDRNTEPSGEWLTARFQKERSVSNATIPNIDVEPPSHSPTNSERTVVDPVLLSPEPTNQPTSLPDHHIAPPSAALYIQHEKHPVYHSPPDNTEHYITGILPSEKFLPPGFIQLSPIPALSNLTSIPESSPQSERSETAPPPKPVVTSSSPPATRRSPNLGAIYSSVPVPGPLSGLPYRGLYSTPVSQDIMVMKAGVSARHDPRTAPSPAPLNRPFSIFSDM